MRTSALRFTKQLALTLGLWACCLLSGAQTQEIEESFKRVSPQEQTRLQAILDEPLRTSAPQAELDRQVSQKLMAVRRLNIPKGEEAILQEAVKYTDNVFFRDNLTNLQSQQATPEKKLQLARTAADNTQGFFKPWRRCFVAVQYVNLGKYSEAQQELNDIQAQIAVMSANHPPPWGQRELYRASSNCAATRSRLEQIEGHFNESLDAANVALSTAEQAFLIRIKGESDVTHYFAAQGLANTFARKAQVLRAMGRLNEAEQTLRDFIHFSTQVELPRRFEADIYLLASNLRFDQHEFVEAEKLVQKGDAILEKLNIDALSPERIGQERNRLLALMGQKKWSLALQELQTLETQIAQQPNLKRTVLYSFDRAYLLLGNQLFDQAAPIFEQAAKTLAKTSGEEHFDVTQAKGLQGVALWHSPDLAQRSQALSLLEQATKDLMQARNADYLNELGFHPDIRNAIVSTYIQALSQTHPERATQLLGFADWLHSGLVQNALSDAAVRSAATTQGLSDLVRQEQDAKNEIQGIRSFLTSESLDSSAPMWSNATQMRNRIFSLEQRRSELQARIRQSFPDYERLVRPLAPSLDDIAEKLSDQEALLVFMPDFSGVNVWMVKQSQGRVLAKFNRASLSQDQLDNTVSTLRLSLESFASSGRLLPFDDALAWQTYQSLIAPFAADLADRKHWIISTSGALARLPFAVLQTQARAPKRPPAWLIQQVSLSQVPSVSAWLNLRAIKRQQIPSQALLAWGDPIFDPRRNPVQNNSQLKPIASGNNGFEQEQTPGDVLYHSIPALPDTRQELLNLAQALHANPQEDLVMGRDATRASVLAASKSGLLAQKKVVVFATHGLMAGDLPALTQPALAMSADGSEKTNALAPLLTLEDVLGLKLNADWVVLSACNTAASDGRANESLSGLARGFFYAGSRSLLVTQWAVESQSAKELTSRTFAHFSQTNSTPKSESLRQAMLEVMAEPRFAHPAFWAPYVLVGDSLR